MYYEPSTMSNNLQLAHNTDGSAMYTSITRPAASPSPAPTYNNPNGSAGEDDSLAVVTAGIDGSVAVKRKRGRPRKYVADDSNSPAAMISPGQTAVDGGGFSSPASSSGKRPRGRPPGSLNKQQPAASGSPGVGFMPHILDVKVGEDMLAKLMWLSQNSTRAVCVMSANGVVSNVTLRQSATSGGTVTYEILSLSGSFMVAEVDGQRSRTGGLSVALSSPDGQVLGGNVAGLLTAASPVQLIVGSFVPGSQKQSRTVETGNNEAEVLNAESSGGGVGYSVDHSAATAANNHHHVSNPQGMSNMPWR